MTGLITIITTGTSGIWPDCHRMSTPTSTSKMASIRSNSIDKTHRRSLRHKAREGEYMLIKIHEKPCTYTSKNVLDMGDRSVAICVIAWHKEHPSVPVQLKSCDCTNLVKESSTQHTLELIVSVNTLFKCFISQCPPRTKIKRQPIINMLPI